MIEADLNNYIIENKVDNSYMRNIETRKHNYI